jgi:hypothetical protein
VLSLESHSTNRKNRVPDLYSLASDQSYIALVAVPFCHEVLYENVLLPKNRTELLGIECGAAQNHYLK